MLDKPYLQPFKNITLTFKESTNSGIFVNKVFPNGNRRILSHDDRFTPVHYSQPNNSWEVALSPYNVVVGVLTESFNHENVPSQVMVSGVVTLHTDTQINPGDKVATHPNLITPTAHTGMVQRATSDHYSMGIALTGTSDAVSEANPEWISVLLCGGQII